MKKIVGGILLLIISGAFFYFQMPVIAYGFTGLGVLVVLISFLALILFSNLSYNQSTKRFSWGKGLLFFNILLIFSLLYFLIIPFFTSSPIFHSAKFKKLLGSVKAGSNISDHIAPISLDEIRTVDKPLANLVGQKILGSQPALGSQVELGEFTIQKIKNELIWVAPLEHSGFFKWLNNREGTPGYVTVSATNERDVKLVQQIGGKPLKIKYQNGSFFGEDLKRKIYFNGNMNHGLTEYSFELDDNGLPFWVVTTYKKEVGFKGRNATGILIVNPQNGELKSYKINEIPDWVDRVQPSGFVQEQIDDWGEYVNGYWNFANINKLTSTEGLVLVYGKDNKSYWYTGLTSVGKDESTVGYMLVDSRTKQATYYKQSGATEYAAQKSAEGKVQEKEFYATTPIPYNINNIPTYVMSLKDNAGLVKMYAMVGINDYTIVGVGNTLRETLTSFKNTYNMSSNVLNTNSEVTKKEIIGVISRIQNDVKNGNSFYYFIIEGSSKIFVGSSSISSHIPVTQVGDSIKIEYDEDIEVVADISSFKNLKLEK